MKVDIGVSDKIIGIVPRSGQNFSTFRGNLKPDSFSKKFNTIPNLPAVRTFPDKLMGFLIKKGLLRGKFLLFMVENCPDRISSKTYKLLIDAEEKLTKYDSDVIIHLRKMMNSNVIQPTDSNFNEAFEKAYMAERDKLGQVPSERKMVIVTGLAGSGKSTYIKNNNLEKNFYLADVDIIKRSVASALGVGLDTNLHKVSQDILQGKLLSRIFEEGKNVVLPTTGMKEYIERLLVAAKNNGYDVTVVNILTDADKCIQRSLTRDQAVERFTDPLFIYKRNVENKTLLRQMKKLHLIDKVVSYENNGENFRLIG